MSNLSSNWKKTKLNGKGNYDEGKEFLNMLLLDAPSIEVKELLLKIKLDATHDANNKALHEFDVKVIQETAKYIDAGGDGLVKGGVCFMIINTLYKYMPHKCNECKRIITSASESKEIKCAGCGTNVCGSCNAGKHVICSPCESILNERNAISEGFYRKNYQKKKQQEAEPEKDMEDILNETDTDWTQRNLPSGQGSQPSSESTLVDSESEGEESENDSEEEKEEENSFSTIVNKKKEKKRKKKEERERKKKEEEENLKKKEKDCEFFLKGLCRHGYKGNLPKGDKKECEYNHPILCKFYINFGKCKFGEECRKRHPTMCSESMKNKLCPNILNGERCRKGWHLKGTVPDYSKPASGNNKGDNLNMNNQNQGQNFLANMVRREMGIILREIFQTPQQTPQQAPQMRKQTGQDYLWALLGNQASNA